MALGGNLGNVPDTFARAESLLRASGHLTALRLSRCYRTAPMGADAGAAFHNAAAVFETSLAPLDLLDLLQSVEQCCSRVRTTHWGPRTLDLDLLLQGDLMVRIPPDSSVEAARLVVPHPALWYRRFVLDPLVELIPEARHPVSGNTIRELRQRLLLRPLPISLPSSAPVPCLQTEIVPRTSAAIAFLPAGEPPQALHEVSLPADPVLANQLIVDVLTAALDEPVVTGD